MSIIKAYVLANGATTNFHKVTKIEITPAGWTAQVDSWGNKESHDLNAPLAWRGMHTLIFPPQSITDPIAAVEESLVQPESVFAGGSLIAASFTQPLDSVRAVRWAEIKQQRDAEEWGGFTVPGLGRFDSDPISQSKIVGAVVAAQVATANGLEYAQDWTLQDNKVVTLDSQTVVQVALAMAAHITSTHAKGTEIREAIDAAADIPAVQSIYWPVSVV